MLLYALSLHSTYDHESRMFAFAKAEKRLPNHKKKLRLYTFALIPKTILSRNNANKIRLKLRIRVFPISRFSST